MLNYLRLWWQSQTGEEETPFDGDAPAWLVSMVFHAVLLVIVALVPILGKKAEVDLTLAVPKAEELEEIEEVKLPQEFFHSTQEVAAIGANSERGVDMALSLASMVSEVSEIVSHEEVDSDVGEILVNEEIAISTGLNFDTNYAVKGAAGEGTTGAEGAIDRITHEIMLSIEERKTHVIWLFDQSASMIPQREDVLKRFDRIYEELGVIEASGSKAFAKHNEAPLLTSVYAFGQNISLRTPKPTENLADIKAAVANLEMDQSGTENIFTAIQAAVTKSEVFRRINPETGEPIRNVMVIVFSDEVGDDVAAAEATIRLCRKNAVPVYVVGIPAPFGRKTTMMKWVDPDPKFSQEPQWGEVTQGPESLAPEVVNLYFAGQREDDAPIDSGFGPFALTRLCYQTGGIYFAVHANRRVGKEVTREETANVTAYFKNFFDPQIMRKYRPDYVSIDEYKRRLAENKCRAALVQAAMMSTVGQLEQPRTRFVRRDEAALVGALSEAQMSAAKLDPKVNALVDTLKLGEIDRAKEDIPRWQAGYDLAMGRALAVKARVEAYNELLALARRGYKFDGKNNTLVLEPTNERAALTSALSKTTEKAEMYLKRVVEQHPDTPWAMLAQRELETPLAWKWKEEFTDLAPQMAGMGGNGPNMPDDDKLRMLEKPLPVRKPPKL